LVMYERSSARDVDYHETFSRFDLVDSIDDTLGERC
jgi:hypothetical protein